MRTIQLFATISFFCNLLLPPHTHAICCHDEITEDDVFWEYMEKEKEMGECSCQYGMFKRQGTLYEFWEPIRIMETVKDPGCMMTKGEEDKDVKSLLQFGHGNETGNTDPPVIFQHVHIVLPDYLMESIAQNDVRCWHVSTGRFDDYMSEGDTAWNNDAIAVVEFPETAVYGSLTAVLSCPLDAAASQFGVPIDVFPWCLGAWGNTFPITGSVGTDDYMTAQLAVAARAVLMGGQEGWIFDTASYYCYPGPMVFFIKSYFKFQPVRPTRRNQLISMGLSAFAWESGLKASTCVDNFAWVLWRKRSCCDSTNGSMTDTDTGSTLDLGTGEANFTSDWLSDKVDLDAIGDLFGDVSGWVNVIIGGVLVEIALDDDGDIISGIADLSGSMDLSTGFIEQTGAVDMSIFGSLDASSATGQGFLSNGNMGSDFSSMGGMQDIFGEIGIDLGEDLDTDFLNDLISF